VIKRIDAGWERWATWVSRHVDQSAIGYPSRTVEARLMSEAGVSCGPPCSICPDVMMPSSVSRFDHVFQVLPKRWKILVLVKYMTNNKKITKKQYLELDRLHYWTDGRLRSIT
jgi:hypothetical protein